MSILLMVLAYIFLNSCHFFESAAERAVREQKEASK